MSLSACCLQKQGGENPMSFNHQTIEKSGNNIGQIITHLKRQMTNQSLNFMH